MAQTVVCLQCRETSVQSLGREDPLEQEMATHSSVLAWRIPMDRGAWRAMDHGVTSTHTHTHTHTHRGIVRVDANLKNPGIK